VADRSRCSSLRIEMASRNPRRVERIHRSVQIVGVAMVVFETANLLDVASDGFCAKPGKQRFFLIRSVSQPAHAKVLERRLYGCHLFVRQSSVPGAIATTQRTWRKRSILRWQSMSIPIGSSNPLSGFAPICIAICNLLCTWPLMIGDFIIARLAHNSTRSELTPPATREESRLFLHLEEAECTPWECSCNKALLRSDCLSVHRRVHANRRKFP
jgi:hypothetical protein